MAHQKQNEFGSLNTTSAQGFPPTRGGEKKRNKFILHGILKKKIQKNLLCGKKGIKGNPRQKIHTKLYTSPKTNCHSTIS